MKNYYLIILMIFSSINGTAQNVGINTSSPNTTLDVNGSVAFRESAISLVNGDNNNLVVSNFSFYRITGPTAAYAITGIGNGINGKVITLYNASTFAMTIRNLSAGSLAVNQVKTLTGSDLVFATGNSSVTLQYSALESKWIVIAQQNAIPQTPVLNQSANSVFGTTGLTVTPTTVITIIPGLSTTINVPAGCVVYLSSTGGIVTTAALATGFSVVDVLLRVDGAFLANGAYARVIAANTTGLTSGMISNWSLFTTVSLIAGNHTFDVSVVGVNAAGASNATVSGNNTSVNQGTLSVVILRQ